jgi:hypothetical protein
MKYSQWIGIAAAIGLVIAAFLPWTYHPDLNKHFTGFFSENSVYGKPGNVFIFLCLFAIAFYAIPKVWAKRGNLLVCGIIMAYAVKSFIVYSGCYRGICPDKKVGLWLMLGASLLMLVMSFFPDVKLSGKSPVGTKDR